MHSIRDLFTIRGFLADKNHDGVPDATRFCVQNNSQLTLEGLVNFYARIGLSTTELDLPSRDMKKNDQLLIIDVSSQIPDGTACLELIDDTRLLLTGASEQAVNQMLSFLAAFFPQNLDLPTGCITTLTYGIDGVVATIDSIECPVLFLDPSQGDQTEAPSEFIPMKSLGELYTVTGLYQGQRRGLNDTASFGFHGLENAGPDVIHAACRLSSRLGLMSNGMAFPLVPDKHPGETRDIHIMVNCRPDFEPGIHLETKNNCNHIHITGNKAELIRGFELLASADCPEEGGMWGSWESEPDPATQIDFPVILESAWADQGEIERFKTWCAHAVKLVNTLTQPAQKLELTAFISKSGEDRSHLEAYATQLFETQCPLSDIRVCVMAGFKPGFFWIRDQLPGKIKPLFPDRIVIRFKETLNHPDHLEMSARWLQEIYPVDEILAASLNIPLSRIELEMDPALETTYRVDVYKQDACIQHFELSVPTTRIAYADDRFSHPVSACAMIFADNVLLDKQEFQSDRERFFRFYHEIVLPEIAEKIGLQKKGQTITEPLFSSLEIHVNMSDEEQRVGVDDEHISPLEMLHEDLYFYTLAWFAEQGRQITGKPWNAPGAVLPFVHMSKNPPSASITLRDFVPQKTSPVVTRALLFSGSKIVLHMEKEGETTLKEIPDGNNRTAAPEKKDEFTYPVSRSFRGLPVNAIELTAPRVSAYRSTHSLSLYKSTILMETGHHGNEVSSTPAMTELIAEIKQNSHWLNRMNIVILHGSNRDGMQLHDRFSSEHPHWMLHAARFNAVGFEFADDYFKPARFGESLSLPRLFKRWVPDVIIDNHGIPSHEWAQPFAGFNSPPVFKVSYWLPYALLYGIARCLDPKKFPEHAKALDQVKAAVCKAFEEQPELMEKNQRLVDRFERYGNRWEPERFPIDHHKDPLFFYEQFGEPDQNSRECMFQYPEWVALQLITEVPDETVTDESLRLCMACQKLFDRTAIQWLYEREYTVENQVSDHGVYQSRPRRLVGSSQGESIEKEE